MGGNAVTDIQRIRAVRSILDENLLKLQTKGESIQQMPLFCDANTGWKMHDAIRVINGVRDLDVYIEQPCLSYQECLSVRQQCPLPMILDESMDDLGNNTYYWYCLAGITNFLLMIAILARIVQDKAADAINLKISKVGGLTTAKTIRDFAVNAAIPMNIEDTW